MKNTLKSTRDYRTAFKGKRTKSQHVLVIRSKDQNSRYGIITPKNVGNAVQRNTLRRVTREVLRETDTQGTLLIMFLKGSGSMSKADIRTELNALLASER